MAEFLLFNLFIVYVTLPLCNNRTNRALLLRFVRSFPLIPYDTKSFVVFRIILKNDFFIFFGIHPFN